MSLTNEQYNLIMRQYEEQQLLNRHALESRVAEVYDKIPAVRSLEEKLAGESIRLAKLLLMNEDTTTSDITTINERIISQKKNLLLSNGFPADYLEMQYSCPDCKDTGYLANDEQCHCFKQKIVKFLYAKSNLNTILERENFSTFSFAYYSNQYIDPVINKTPLDNIKRVVNEAKDFTGRFSFGRNNGNLLIYGNAGVGKTFLVNCIAKELLDKSFTVIYLTAFQLFEILEKYTFSHEKGAVSEDYNLLLSSDLLIIDDLGTELANAFTNSQLYRCINERYLREKSTIISTNLSFEMLQANYSERIFSRIVSYYTLLKIIGDDIRIGR